MESKNFQNEMMNDGDVDMEIDQEQGGEPQSFGFVDQPIQRFQKPTDLKAIQDPDKLFKAYEKVATEAVCMVVMTYSSLNTASDLQFNKANRNQGNNQKLQADLKDKVRE